MRRGSPSGAGRGSSFSATHGWTDSFSGHVERISPKTPISILHARLRVGLTNGCFDLMHPGHVVLFKRSRASCDRLVVALNADASVRRLTGEGGRAERACA
jgi:cytidyltransferase-like protein